MNVIFPIIVNLILSIIIFFIAVNIYMVYRRMYLFWFLIILGLVPFLFLFSLTEFEYLSQKSSFYIVIYPIIIIFIELSTIMAQRTLLSSLKTARGEVHSRLLREDVKLIRAFGRISNYFIGKISLIIGIKNVEQIIEDSIEKYPLLTGCYIGSDERLKTLAMEESISEQKELRMQELCEAFSFFINKLIDTYATFVPYEEIVGEMEKEVTTIDKNIIKYFVPLVIFKGILEPITREIRGEMLKNIRFFIDIQGIYINRKGGIELKKLYDYDSLTIENKFVIFLTRLLQILGKERELKKRITDAFRRLPQNVKQELYRHEFIKNLPTGILEEEKIVLMSKEKLIDELIDRQGKLEEAYARLADAKLNRMKANFIDIIAHELKTPLTSIKTYTDLIRKEKLGLINNVQKEKLELMTVNIDRLNGLIDDMLQIPTVDEKDLELRKEFFNAKEVIDIIVDEVGDLAREKKQIINVDINDNAIIFGDKNLIGKAIKNIVINAVKYTDLNGNISIVAKRDANFTHLIISDTGKGIRKEDIEQIFEPFYSLENGAGLGLSIAKNIIESHGGKITVESIQGTGSHFHIFMRCE